MGTRPDLIFKSAKIGKKFNIQVLKFKILLHIKFQITNHKFQIFRSREPAFTTRFFAPTLFPTHAKRAQTGRSMVSLY